MLKLHGQGILKVLWIVRTFLLGCSCDIVSVLERNGRKGGGVVTFEGRFARTVET
jgi:hypothetical protein